MQRRRGWKAALMLGALGALAGCSSTIHEEAVIGGVDTLSLDAKQRLMLTAYNPDGRKVVCLEPSPDAIVAQAAVLAAEGEATRPDQARIGTAISAGSTESVGSIAMRTQTIQLMRDGYYRLCEGLMNGVIDDQDYQQIIDNIDTSMAVIMAIDALGTRGQAAPAIAISAGSITTAAGSGAAEPTTAGTAAAPAPVFAAVQNGGPAVSAADGRKAEAEAVRDIIKDYLEYRRLVASRY